MAELSSYIIIDRNILKWRHFKDTKCLAVFLWLILNANPISKKGNQKYFNRGEVMTTIEKIAEETGLSYKSVQRSMETLKKSGEILIFRLSRGTKIVVKNYKKYQNQQAYRDHVEAVEMEDSDNEVIGQFDHFSQVEWSKPTTVIGQNDSSRLVKNDISVYNTPNVVLSTTNEYLTKEKKTKERTRTRDDIPLLFRERFASYDEYDKWRNQ